MTFADELAHAPYALAAWLFVWGLWGVVSSRHFVHLVLCLGVVQTSTYVLLTAIGDVAGGVAPVYAGIEPGTRAVDPVVQAMMLTDIVVEATVVALLLAIVVRVHERTGKLDPNDFARSTGDALPLAPLPIVVPLFVAAVLAGTGHRLPRRVADALAITAAAAAGVLALLLLLEARSGTIVYWMGGWRPRHGIAVGVALAVDPVGAGLGVLSAVLACAALVFTLRRFDNVHALFHALMLAFLGALVAFGEAGDLFDLFVFFELMSAAAYALCGYKSDEVGPLQGALNFAVVNTVGAFLVLFGIGLVYGRTGALNFAHVSRALGTDRDALVIASFWLIACGFLVKAAVFPFHFWLPDAHAVAPTPVSVMFSGVMVTAGLYAVARVWWSVFAAPLAPREEGVRAILLVLGAATGIVGASMCWAQRHLKRLLAFSTVGHVGVMTMGIALLDTRGLAASMVYALGHGLVKGALFLLAGCLLHALRTVDEIRLQGRGPRAVGVLWVAAALGLAGLAPFGTAAGEAILEHAARSGGHAWAGAVTAFVEVVTGGAALRVAGRVFLGWGPHDAEARGGVASEEPETEGPPNIPWPMTASAAALVALALAVGAAPGVRDGALSAAASLEDTNGYAARVLGDGPAAPGPEPAAPAPVHFGLERGFATAAGALGLAFVTLFRRRMPERVRAPVRTLLQTLYAGLRAAHTGHVADYVTWLVVGTAAIGVAAELAMRG